MRQEIIGYTTGVYDLFHVGHVNVLKRAKALCDRLIVWVTSDELVSYKNKKAVIPYEERAEIVSSIQYVDLVVPQESMDKMDAWRRYSFDRMFVWDDRYKSSKWNDFESQFKEVGVEIIYFPYTKGSSSTLLNETLKKIRNDDIVISWAWDSNAIKSVVSDMINYQWPLKWKDKVQVKTH